MPHIVRKALRDSGLSRPRIVRLNRGARRRAEGRVSVARPRTSPARSRCQAFERLRPKAKRVANASRRTMKSPSLWTFVANRTNPGFNAAANPQKVAVRSSTKSCSARAQSRIAATAPSTAFQSLSTTISLGCPSVDTARNTG
jgi:hypothetical protein